MSFSEDLSIFFDPNYGGTAAYVNGGSSPVYGIFQNEYVDIAAGGIELTGTRPVFTCATSDVSAVDADDTLLIGAVTYTVVYPAPDSTGVTKLVLKR